MKRLKRIGYLAIFCLLCYGCPEELPEHDLVIQIENNTNEKIVCFTPIGSIGETIESSDTTLTEDFPWGDINSIYDEDIVDPYSDGEETFFSYHMEDALNNGSIHFYIFNYDSLVTIPWERIRNEYIVSKRVDFDTWEELESADFTITYP